MTYKEELEKCSVKEKLDFIKSVLSLPTHITFTKDDLLLLIKAQDEIIEKMKRCENCKYQYYENGINYCNNRCQKNLYNNWELKG